MTIEQLITQWNASAENAQQQPDSQTSPADLPQPDSAVQVRTGVTAGNPIKGIGGILNGGNNDCTYSFVETSSCWW
jgi:hypothetical protein